MYFLFCYWLIVKGLFVHEGNARQVWLFFFRNVVNVYCRLCDVGAPHLSYTNIHMYVYMKYFSKWGEAAEGCSDTIWVSFISRCLWESCRCLECSLSDEATPNLAVIYNIAVFLCGMFPAVSLINNHIVLWRGVREYGAMTNSCVIQGWACALKTIFRTSSPTVACAAVGAIIIMDTVVVGYAGT